MIEGNENTSKEPQKMQNQDQMKMSWYGMTGLLSIAVTLLLIGISMLEDTSVESDFTAMDMAISEKAANELQQSRQEMQKFAPPVDVEAIKRQAVKEQQEIRIKQLRQQIQVLEQSVEQAHELQNGLLQEEGAYKQAVVDMREVLAKKKEQEKIVIAQFHSAVNKAVEPIEKADKPVSELVDSLTEYRFVAGTLPVAMFFDKIQGTATVEEMLQAKIIPLTDLALAAQSGAENAIGTMQYAMESIQNEYARESGQVVQSIETGYGVSMVGFDRVRNTMVHLAELTEMRSFEITKNHVGVGIDLLFALPPISKAMWSCLAGPVSRLVKAAPWLAGLSQADTPAIGPADAIAAVIGVGFMSWNVADIHRTRIELRDRLTHEMIDSLTNQAKLIRDGADKAVMAFSGSDNN